MSHTAESDTVSGMHYAATAGKSITLHKLKNVNTKSLNAVIVKLKVMG